MPMEKSAVKKRGLAAILALSPAAHLIALLGGGIIAAFFALRHDRALMQALSAGLVQPLHRFLARLTALVPFPWRSGCMPRFLPACCFTY